MNGRIASYMYKTVEASNTKKKIRKDSNVFCVGSYSLRGVLSRRGLNPIKAKIQTTSAPLTATVFYSITQLIRRYPAAS